MEDLGVGAGLAALAFWGFIAVAVLAAVWDGIRKRDAQHETMRRLIESGQPIDQKMMKKLSLVGDSGEARHDQAFQITGLWLLPVAVGMAIFALILGSDKPEALAPLLVVSSLLTCMGIVFLVAAKIAGHWYPAGDDSTPDQRTE